MKKQIFEYPIETNVHLVARITVFDSDIREIYSIFTNMLQSLFRRFEACITAGRFSSE